MKRWKTPIVALLALVPLAGAGLAAGGSGNPGPPPSVQQPAGADTEQQGENQSELQGENESGPAGESEQGTPGEPAGGHEDPPSQDVNHECTGDCVE